ncbi:MAG TPA: hypothetical protein VM677_19730 [Actinokineospora sp.]|jgi:hypothetical protein|nr:hypothetical protein [Actinokineospora sp.]
MQGWRQEGEHFLYEPPDQDTWDELRAHLTLGQQFSGTIVWVPRPGVTGIGVDLGLPVGGFVDGLLLPFDGTRWPTRGTVAEFKIWWMDERPQLRLVPIDPAYRREDFDTWLLTHNTAASAAFLKASDL